MAACAKGLDIDESKVSVDYGSKTVNIDADVDIDELAAALEGTKYSISK